MKNNVYGKTLRLSEPFDKKLGTSFKRSAELLLLIKFLKTRDKITECSTGFVRLVGGNCVCIDPAHFHLFIVDKDGVTTS